MSAITREQLSKRAREKVNSLEFAVTQTAFAESRAEPEEELELARIALASLEAEPAISIRIKDGWPEPNSAALVVGVDRLSDGVHELYTVPPAQDTAVAELTMWVKRLAHSLRNARPDDKLHSDAMDYLSRKGLISVEDVLR